MLMDVINRIFKGYGYYSDVFDSFTFKGINSADKIRLIVDKFGNLEEHIILIFNANIVQDYKTSNIYYKKTLIVNK